jgi:hypothetical protein
MIDVTSPFTGYRTGFLVAGTILLFLNPCGRYNQDEKSGLISGGSYTGAGSLTLLFYLGRIFKTA